MVKPRVHLYPSADRRRLLEILLIVLLIGLLLWILLLPAASDAQRVLRAQPQLLALAAHDPAASLGVIVQKQGPTTRPEQLVARLGGAVTQDLSIINAFAAELPAGAVSELAQAPGVRWVSYDAPVERSQCKQCIETDGLLNTYIEAIGADRVWNSAPYLQGQGIAVAVVDSGINDTHKDIKGRIVASVNISRNSQNTNDGFGHGTHVAGIIAGNGSQSGGDYIGVAPKASLINVKVTDDQGAGRTSDVVRGLGWVLANRARYNIRVVNLSMNSSTPESYHVSPLDAALEVLWFNRIVVVVSAGNSGRNGISFPPGNDPFVITVGASNDQRTARIADDAVAAFSSYGTTESGFSKPDLAAPGVNIIGPLAKRNSVLARKHPDHMIAAGAEYFRMSGTSMSAAVTTGAVALLLQSNPALTPDQVKARLISTAQLAGGPGAGAGYLNIYNAVASRSLQSANGGVRISRLLSTGSSPVRWNSLNWNSINWDSVNWDSVNWDSVNWDSVNWDNAYWGR